MNVYIILDFGPWRWDVLKMSYANKRTSKMQEQHVFEIGQAGNDLGHSGHQAVARTLWLQGVVSDQSVMSSTDLATRTHSLLGFVARQGRRTICNNGMWLSTLALCTSSGRFSISLRGFTFLPNISEFAMQECLGVWGEVLVQRGTHLCDWSSTTFFFCE